MNRSRLTCNASSTDCKSSFVAQHVDPWQSTLGGGHDDRRLSGIWEVLLAHHDGRGGSWHGWRGAHASRALRGANHGVRSTRRGSWLSERQSKHSTLSPGGGSRERSPYR